MEHGETLGEDVVSQTKQISEACPPFKKVSKRKKKLPGRKQRLLKKIKELQEDLKTHDQGNQRVNKKKACDRSLMTTNPKIKRLVARY